MSPAAPYGMTLSNNERSISMSLRFCAKSVRFKYIYLKYIRCNVVK